MSYTVTVSKGVEDYTMPLDPREYEAISGQTWQELTEQAKKAQVPFSMITVCYLNEDHLLPQISDDPQLSQKPPLVSLYDTMHFLKYLQNNLKNGIDVQDPLTRLQIKNIDILFAKTFDIETVFGIDSIKECTSFNFKHFFTHFDENTQIICLTANNSHANESNIENKTAITKYQFIVATKLFLSLNEEMKEEAKRWFFCSALRGHLTAIRVLKEEYELTLVNELLPTITRYASL